MALFSCNNCPAWHNLLLSLSQSELDSSINLTVADLWQDVRLVIQNLGAACVCLYFGLCGWLCVCVSVYLCLCWSMLDREQGLRRSSTWGIGTCWGGEQSAQDSFFLILYSRRGEEASVLFFLALALTALSGYWSGALMQTCQINFAGREGGGCCKIVSPLKGWGGWMEGWVEVV